MDGRHDDARTSRLVRPPMAVPTKAGAWGVLDADLVSGETSGVSVSIYSDPNTDTGSNRDNVLPPWTMTSGTLKSGTWVELIRFGGAWYAWPLPSVHDITVDMRIEEHDLQHATKPVFAPFVDDESEWVTWHTGDACPEEEPEE